MGFGGSRDIFGQSDYVLPDVHDCGRGATRHFLAPRGPS
jgi:hypothetical protein